MKEKEDDNYKIVLSELGTNPFRTVETVFVLMFLIPLLVVFYLITKEQLLQRLFSTDNSIAMVIAILIALIGLLYAYLLIRRLIAKLLRYAQERKIADNEKNEVMLAVVHDLKNPLSMIKYALDNLAEGIGGALNSAHAETVQICLSGVDRLFKFIEDILKSSNDDFLKRVIVCERFDLGGLIKKEVENTMPLAQRSGLSLRHQIPAGEMFLWGDQNKLSRVVMNLISNAIKYTPQGGSIDVKLFSGSGTITFSVLNTGPGLTSEETEKIFKKYRRLKQHAGIEGTGLGLSIVKEIVDLHNGHITVQSELGENTEFRVVLPRDRRKVSPS